MKKAFINIMATTGITLIILALIGTLYGGRFLFIKSVFQSFGANIIIYLGLIITHKFESGYVILEAMLDIGYTISVILIFGLIFDWYDSISPWMLAGMSIIIYFIGCLGSIFRMREDVKMINELLKNRNRPIPK